MKKVILSFFVVSSILLTGCSNADENKVKPPQHLLADEENYYSLLIIDKSMAKTRWNVWKEINNVRNVKRISWSSISLKQLNKQYKFLKLEELPAFIAFDTKGVAFKTNNEKKLITFLHEKVPNSWNH